ncbi:MAG: PAS domain S-box protein [Acidobacteria bacterium]|nr:PAS domain S-box protein [Acidobacteriota bacterium]
MTMKSTRRTSRRAKEAIQDLSKFPSDNPNPVLRIARDGTLLYINEAGVSLLPQWHLDIGQASPPVLRDAVFRSMDTGATQELDLEHGERVYSFFVAPIIATRFANLYGHDVTEHKRANAALRESEARFRAIVSHTPDHIILQDRDLRYRFVINPQLGLTEADMIGKHERDFLGKEDAEKLTAIKTKVMETGEPFHSELSLQNSKGETEFFEGAYIPKFDLTGKADGLIGYFRNITERKRAEEALRASEGRFRQLFDNISSGAAVFEVKDNGDDFVFVDFNKAGERLDGDRKQDLLGKSIHTVRPGIREFGLLDVFRRVWETGIPEHYPARVYRDKKRIKWYENYVYRLPSGEIVSVYDDVTERKQKEEIIRESEASLAEAQRSAQVGSWDWDLKQDKATWSVEMCRIYGVEPGGFRNLDESLQAIHPEDRESVRKAVEDALEGKKVYKVEHRVIRSDGSTRTVHAQGETITGEGGKPVRMRGTVQDITERQRAEERMRTFSREIITTREEERKKVSSVLHHDVGSLAVGISAHLDAIEEDLRAGKPREALKWTKRTRQLFDESVARLKEVAVELRPPELDLLGLCAALRQHFSKVTRHGGIRIHFRDTLGRRRVSGDTATTLFRVVQEALTNAITHGDAKQVDVFLSASRKEVKLTVRDNGAGFSPSGQTGKATSRMGLRVMKEMAASLGGGFKIDTRRGKGTTVRVSLPHETAALRPEDVTVRKETVARGETIRSARRGSRPQKVSGA